MTKMRNRSLVLIIFAVFTPACEKERSSGQTVGLSPDHRYLREGETLYSIAEREYGDPLAWPLLQEANPWLEPEKLQPGDIIYIPPKEPGNRFNVDPRRVAYAAPRPPLRTMNPVGSAGTRKEKKEQKSMGEISGIFQNIMPDLEGRTLLGEPVDRVGFIALAAFFGHAFVQGFLLWIVATVTFVRNVTLKKSLRAAFQTEIITLFAVIVLGGVAVLMIHIGTTAPGGAEGGGGDLLTTLETYLKNPLTPVIAGFAVLGLYLLLCMRFIPQVFGIQRAQSTLLVFVAVLVPHVMGLYTVGQRLGLVKY